MWDLEARMEKDGVLREQACPDEVLGYELEQ